MRGHTPVKTSRLVAATDETAWRGIVGRQQRISDLQYRARKPGVEGRLARFCLSQARGESPRPL